MWAETWLRFALGAGACLTLSKGIFMPDDMGNL